MLKIALVVAAATLPAAAGTVIVVVDMDASRPGIQSTIDVPPGTTVVPGVAVYIYAPQGGASMVSIGYIGAIDRGIAFGHMRTNSNIGSVASLTAHQGVGAVPGNNGYPGPAFDPAFDGPEVQYGESGVSVPTPIPTSPGPPLFTVDVNLANATRGDVFRFFLCDYVRIWSGGGHGSFTTQPGGFLDTGGDSVPDGTVTRQGVDLDTPMPVPPAAFSVDYIDGPGGAKITVGGGCYANCDGSSTAPVLNVLDFACFLNHYASADSYANCDASTTPPVLNVQDFTCFINRFAAGCT